MSQKTDRTNTAPDPRSAQILYLRALAAGERLRAAEAAGVAVRLLCELQADAMERQAEDLERDMNDGR